MCGGGGSGSRRSAGTAARRGTGTTVSGTCATCPRTEQARLVSVEWLDASAAQWNRGTPTAELGAEGKQYVNFPRDRRWDRARVAKLDRLGHSPPVRIRFNRPGVHHFRIRVTFRRAPRGRPYTPAERTRRPQHFGYTRQAEGHTDPDGTVVLRSPIQIATAGGDRYRLEAQDDHGTRKQSKWLKVYRRVYLFELKMRRAPCATSLGALRSEFQKHKIEMVSLGSRRTPRQENIGSGAEQTTFENNARTVFQRTRAARMVPYVIVVGYTDHLAVRNGSVTLRRVVQVGTGHPTSVTIQVRARGLVAPHTDAGRALWRNIVTGQSWLVSARFLRTGQPAMDISGRCTAPGGDPCYRVQVNTAGLPAGTGTIELRVNVVDRMRGGISVGGNLVLVCTRAWWQNKSTASQNETAIHEIGHKFGFVPDDTDLDRTPRQYTDHGHVGSHCAEGLSAAQFAQASYSSVSGTCVMFGSTNGQSAFCSKCAKAMRKQDFCGGWALF